MGWLWATPKPAADSKDGVSPATEQTKPASASTPQASRPDYDSDPELDKFLAMIRAELEPKSTAREEDGAPRKSSRNTHAVDFTPDAVPPTQATQPKPSTLTSWLPFRTPSQQPPPPTTTSPLSSRTASASSTEEPPQPTDIDEDSPAESQYPTGMSCRQAFDYAFACNAVGGQWNAVYRYGTIRDCSEPWADFWFCMRTRSYGNDEEKARAFRDYYREKERKKYYVPGARSSEDVWEARREKVGAGEAFAEKVDERAVPEGMTDDEWRAAEIERRKKIRREFGIKETS